MQYCLIHRQGVYMADKAATAGNLLNAIAAEIPLVEKTDLASLMSIMSQLEELAGTAGMPKAFKSTATRAARLCQHIIMDETPFESGLKKLTDSVTKMTRAHQELKPAPDGGSAAADDSEVVPNVDDSEVQLADDVKDLLIKFASQQLPVLEDFESYLLEHEKGNPNAQPAMKRILHTWKGEFGVLDLRDYAQLIHDVEEALEDGRLSIDNLFRLKDTLAAKLEQCACGRAPAFPGAEREAILRADACFREPDRKTAPDEAAGDELQPALQTENIPTSGQKAFEGDPSLMGDFITESRDHIHTGETSLLELESDPANGDSLNSIFRSCHTIKGVAGFLGLADVQTLAHSMENVMDMARKGELLLLPGHIDLLLESMDCLKALIDSLEANMANGSYTIPAGYKNLLERLASPHDIAVAAAADDEGESARKVGEILIARGEATRSEVEAALHCQQQGDSRRLGEILIGNKEASPRQVAGALASQQSSRKPKTIEETIRVPVERLDQLIDAIGEAVIAQSMIAADPHIRGARDQGLEKKVAQTNVIMRNVQELSMSLRMVSLKSTFQKMARLVRDLAKKSGKAVDFITEGEDTELDKSVVENIGDPLIHMIRNSIDHGIESDTQERTAGGKAAGARVVLRAFHKAGSIYIEIEDDGRGLNKQAILDKAVKQGLCTGDEKFSDQETFQFIFKPGFSTARKITDVSGRGVGMDVVRRNIQALRGSVEIQSERGKGTTFSIRLPLTLAIIDGMIVRLGTESYILPTLSILESLKPAVNQVETVLGRGEIIQVRDEHIKLLRLSKVFHQNNGHPANPMEGIVILVEDMLGKRVALLVDEILGQQQVVIKSLGQGIGDIPGVSGGAIMSDGNVSLILDIGSIVKFAGE
ncbi:MAG: chemotaxis protein CheA [Chitinivibrionales bacterium]|nr:chemotaxis protein CheA [Chitinivibrionales bacterium]